MPFTASHPAAVLPFVRRAGLVPAALVIGSMAPDLPYYLQLGSDAGLTHSALGIVTVDVLMGLVAFVGWQGLVAPAAWAYAPSRLRRRIDAPAPLRPSMSGAAAALLLVASLVLGGLTHVLWDAFTHQGRWGTELIPWLTTEHGPLPGYRWAQYASTILGLVAIGWFVAAWWRRTGANVDASPEPHAGTPMPREALAFWALLAIATLVGAAAGLADALSQGDGLRRGLFRAATWGGGLGLLVLLASSLAFAVRPRRRAG